MKFAFIGAVEFSQEMLKEIIHIGYLPSIVITQKSRGINADYIDLEPLCKQWNVPILKEDELNKEYILEALKKYNLDYIFCFGWSRLLTKEILSIPKKGVIGYHPAKLPMNRGRHPIIWALFLGLDQTASTFFFMDEGVDSGDIISQVDVPIYYEDDALSLYNRLIETAKIQIRNLLPQLESDTYIRIKQQHEISNYWRKRGKEDGRIDFRMCSRAIYNLVRALTHPYVGAHLIYKEKEIKVWKVKEEKIYLPNIEPGKILKIEDSNILVKTYDNGIWLLEHEFIELPKVGEYL